MTALTHEWPHKGDVITFTWLDTAVVIPDRVYALAFTPAQKMLLVTDPEWDPAGWLPGGGIEPGETPEQALARELAEEANATLYHPQKIGAQRAVNSSGRQSFHVFYWCRIILGADFSPQHEVTKRLLVNPNEFLDRLLWGHSDPKARLLLERALTLEQTHNRLGKIT